MTAKKKEDSSFPFIFLCSFKILLNANVNPFKTELVSSTDTENIASVTYGMVYHTNRSLSQRGSIPLTYLSLCSNV